MKSFFKNLIVLFTALLITGMSVSAEELTDQEIENIVRRSYQYVAMYNVNNKFAFKNGGWNTVVADTQLKDHTLRDIARSNNDRKKYSVGENGGMKLNADGGIEVYVSEKKPENVPEEDWLPISRKDENLDVILRLYMPDIEKYKTWNPPKAEMVGGM